MSKINKHSLPPLSTRNYIGFGLGDFAFNLFFQGTALFLLFFYTDVLGINPAQAGLVFLIATIWDAISDPLMGYLAGRTRSRWGRYRPYLLIAALPIGLSYTAMFYPTDYHGTALIYRVLFLQLLFRTFFTLGNIPYSSLSSEMTKDTHERSKLAAYRMFLGYAGALTVSYLTNYIMVKLGWDAATNGFFKIGLLFTALALILFTITFYTTFERQSNTKSGESYKLKDIVEMLLQNRPFILLCTYILVGMAGVIFFYQTLNYFFKYVLQSIDALGMGMLCLFAALMIALPFWLHLSKRRGKRFTLLVGCAWLMVSSLAFYLNPLAKQEVAWTFFHMSLIGIGIGCAAFSFWAMLPDTVEYGEWKSGVRAEGVIFGIGLFSLKLGLGIGSFILGQLLDWIGYQANEAQSAATLGGLHTITTLCIAFTALLIIIIMMRYPLTAQHHQALVKELS